MSPRLKPPAFPGKIIGGKYELLEIAGKGGMATVWRARLEGPGRFARTVAIKHMHSHLAEQPLYVDMFLEEARVGAALQDPNIAQVYDFVVENDQYFLVMEWVDGIDLGTYVHYIVNHKKQLPRWELIAAVGIGMVRGLAAAHERTDDEGKSVPIVHRDVSPHNILISVKGPAKIIDFGLSLARDREGELTQPGIAKGKIAYLSPEVARGNRPTPASDQFAAGSVLWEALVGRRLFHGQNDFEVYQRLVKADAEPLHVHRPDIPEELAKLVHRALSVNAKRRFASTREMARQLSHVLRMSRETDDLYHALAETVKKARADMGIGHRTQAPDEVTPTLGPSSSQIEVKLPLATPPKARSLTDRIPFLRGKKKR